MRLGVAALAAVALSGAQWGDWATASLTRSTLSLRLHYPMTCGQPGAGPLVVTLPRAFRITGLRVTVRGVQRPAALSGRRLTIDLPKPPQVTCMSITEGTLPVTVAHARPPAGTYVVTAAIGTHTFSARLRVP